MEKFTGAQIGGEYKLKNYQEVVSSSSNAVLVSLDDGNINIADLPKGAVREILISEIELAYLLESGSTKVIQPVYLLKGKANMGSAGGINAVMYLPAIRYSLP